MNARRSHTSGLRHRERAATLVVGLGNPILGDDGVGWRVAERVGELLAAAGRLDVEVACLALGGLSLMEHMVGYARAIVIDAVTTGAPVGTVRILPLGAFGGIPDRAFAHATAAHDTTLPTALELGREMGVRLPERVVVVGVEAASLYEFGETLTPEVARAVPVAAERVLALLAGAGPRRRVSRRHRRSP